MTTAANIDTLIETAVFAAEPGEKAAKISDIRNQALDRGIRPASIQGLMKPPVGANTAASPFRR